ncbi:hypothetical protein [uncultured Erythrobacter sp.]|uniref:hypothetical protein n=1 Tax=uncultured Erythrobacter sp. TaxID=263913 RepID=UPI00261EBB14|nr:hypothetical protein [uncultured Erythrobacter sp.]
MTCRSAALSLAFALIGLAANAQTVGAPAGWSDSQQGDKRVLTKNGVLVEIGPWQSSSGKSTGDWLKSQERVSAPGVSYVSTQSMQAEAAVPGSYSLARSVKVNGRDQLSVLYACPGKGGTVKLMELRAVLSRQTASDIQRAAKFGEAVCRADSNYAANSPTSGRTAAASGKTSSAPGNPGQQNSAQSLAAANASIPAGSRPRSARIVLEQKWVGFPAVMVNTATPEMSFANGYSTTCAKWNPLRQTPTPTSAGMLKRCKFKRGASKGKAARKFSPGETINISYGRITGSSRSFGSSSSSISGGTLRMTKDGRIQIGEFNAFSVSSAGSGAGGGNRKIAVSGRYYLNGHTITIQADDGRIFHGFIAASSKSGGTGYDYIFINGEHYWDRKK